MHKNTRNLLVILLTIFLLILLPCPDVSKAQIERFLPKQGGTTELWRLTNDPTMRDWANYHNTNAWSPDGRYLCYVHQDPYMAKIPSSYEAHSSSEIYIYDLFKDKAVRIDNGSNPRWANNHNWLFYSQLRSKDGQPNDKDTYVMWLDVDTGKITQIAGSVSQRIGGTDCSDRWLYGVYSPDFSADNQTRQGVRIPIEPNSRPEILEGLHGFQWITNPEYPVVFSRHDHRDSDGRDLPFAPTRFWCDMDGKNIRVASIMIQRCHQSWSGDGLYHLHGNSLMSGRKWNEPFPSNLHILASITCGDLSPCGKSGRWLSGSGNKGPLQIADLWSGDGRIYLKAGLSHIHDSNKFSYSFGSALHDNDAKGSPDGTKIVFVTNYDLKDAPVTEITEDVSGDRIPVKSTEGFPDAGGLSIGNEVIGYAYKTPTGFEKLTRGLYNTSRVNLEGLTPELMKEFEERTSDNEFLKNHPLQIFDKLKALYSRLYSSLTKGQIITSFEFRCIPGELRKKMNLPFYFTQDKFPASLAEQGGCLCCCSPPSRPAAS